MVDRSDRFWSKVDRSAGAEGCWPWTASRNYKGYGLFWNGEKLQVATRWGWTHTFGPIPPGVFVCHSCDNPSCMNPAHWFIGSAAVNNADRDAKGRQAGGQRNGSHTRPDRLVRGDAHWSRSNPEKRPRGDAHYARVRPEVLPRGEAHGRAKLTETSVREIRARHAGGVLTNVLAKEFHLSDSTVRRIVARKTWSHVL